MVSLPNELQWWVLTEIARHTPAVAVVGGWGVGKTHLMALAIHALTKNRPSEDGMLVYPTTAQGIRAFGALGDSMLRAWGWTWEATFLGAPAPHWRSPFGPKVWAVGYFRPSTVDSGASNIEGINAGWALVDEAPRFRGPEVADMVWGRVRDGYAPFIGIFGRPSFYEWWPEWADRMGGRQIRASTALNRKNIKNWSQWVRGMTREQRDERLHCRPAATEGAVLSNWRAEEWPAGNLISDKNFQYDPGMRGYLAMDPGYRHPSVGLVARDEARDLYVIVREFNPEAVSTAQLAQMINARAVARVNASATDLRFRIDEGIGDVAGGAKNEQTARSVYDALAMPPEATPPGIGVRVQSQYAADPARKNVATGIQVLRDLVCDSAGVRRLVMTREAWAESARAPGVSIARAIHSYVFRPGTDEPKKDGTEHPIDWMRYLAVTVAWPVQTQVAQAPKRFYTVPHGKR